MIPQQLNLPNLRFCRIKIRTKKPFERDWVNKPYTYEEVSKFNGENYGVLCGYGNLIVIDADTPELRDYVEKELPITFKVKTGSGGFHYYFLCSEIKKKIVLQKGKKHYGEVQSMGTQVVGPGSIHPNGTEYHLENNEEIKNITKEQLFLCITPFMKEVVDEEIKVLKQQRDYGDSDINSISITQIINTTGFKKAFNGEYFGINPWHGSSTGMNTWINPSKNVAHCFRCDCGISVAKAIALNEGIIRNCSDSLSKDNFKEVIKIAQGKYGLKKRENPMTIFTSKKSQSSVLNKTKPFFYDKSGMFWLWNDEEKKWEKIDDIDILNMIDESTGQDIISSKSRTEILNSLKQEGRKHIPKNIKKTWIQFKSKIYDVSNGEEFDATPEYFVTNPIPWNLHKERFVLTPTIDKIFEEWVGKENVQTLYEILSYCLLPDYPIHRLFCLIGNGSNGKGCFLRLIDKFIGSNNVSATELDTLLISRFEITRLYKKLVCLMGETDFGELSKTSVIKKLTGQDMIGFEWKNKTPFEDYNYAKILISTNNLPTTTDKTMGFYRRWLIIDFPNTFSEEIDILKTIPDEEFEILAFKCCGILADLLKTKKFNNEGSMEDRAKKYEDKSDPIEKFMKDNVEEDPDGFIWKWEFEKRLNEWCRENRHRQMAENTIGKKMKDKGIEEDRKKAVWWDNGLEKEKRVRVWVGIKWRFNNG